MPANAWVTSAQFCGPDTGFVVGALGMVLRSVDGGATWQTQASGIASDLYSVYFADALHGYACGDDGIVIKTTDGGASWIAEEHPVPSLGGRPSATFVRGVLFLPEAASYKPQAASLLDAAGRKVLDLHAGANDVSRFASGVYFVRAVSCELSAVGCHKVVIQR
jgi:hypothetical protein